MLNEMEQAVLLIATLNELAARAKKGIVSYDDYVANRERCKGCVVYDSRETAPRRQAIVSDMIAAGSCLNIVSTYDDIFPGVRFSAVAEGEAPYIDVELPGGSSIVVEDGRWYVSGY